MGFCPKSCYRRPSCNLFMNVVQLPGANLPHGIVPGAPLLDGETFFLFSLIFGMRFCENFRSTRHRHSQNF